MGQAFLMQSNILRANLEPNKQGVYVLGSYEDKRFYPVYVGRADSCLLTRLLTHNHRNQVTHVEWRVTSSIRQAYLQECCFYHTYEDEHILNKIHPAKPGGTNLICPICCYTEIDMMNFKERANYE